MTVRKDWRAFELEDGRTARAARAWIESPMKDADGGATIQQSFALELWIDREPGCLRLQVLWAEVTFASGDFTDEEVASTTLVGIDQVYQRHEEWLGEQ